MRFRLLFELKEKEFPIDYRRIFISFIKKSFSKKSDDIFREYYNKKDSIQKHFSFSINFGECDFKNERIYLKNNKIIMTLSSIDNEFAINFYNSVLQLKNKEFKIPNSNSMVLYKIVLENEKWIDKNEIDFKIISPVIIREHNKENNKDYFYTFQDPGANKILKNNIINSLNNSEFNNLIKYVDSLIVKPIKFRKTIVSNYSIKIPVSLGLVKLIGNEMIIDYIYKSGLGSKRSNGFGLLDIL